MKLCYLSLIINILSVSFSFAQECNCNHTVGADQVYFDGKKNHVNPGDKICVLSSNKKYLQFKNVHGTKDNIITIINCGGEVKIDNTDFGYGIKIDSSSHFRFTGTGNPKIIYGFKIMETGPNASGLTLGGLSTDYEIDHIEISHTGFAGIMAKTDPNCGETQNRKSFVQNNTVIHHNYIHETGGEGMYIGNSFYNGYKDNKCPDKKIFPHQIAGLKVYENIIYNSGWDGIQIGSAVSDVQVYKNTIRNYGLSGIKDQRNGIQIGEGTRGNFYHNVIENGKGNGIIVLGAGEIVVFNNAIAGAGEHGIFCDDRNSLHKRDIDFVNNTIINPELSGIKILNDTNTINCYNNIVMLKKHDELNYISLGKQVQCSQVGNFYDCNNTKVKFTEDYLVKFIALEKYKGYDVSSYLEKFQVKMEDNKLKKPLGYQGRD